MAINPELINYVKMGLARKLSEERVKQKLLAAGWTETEVEGAINFVKQEKLLSRQQIQQTPSMNKQLIDYVRICLEHGTSPEQVKQKLLAAGWTETEVEGALELMEKKAPSIASTLPSSVIKLKKIKSDEKNDALKRAIIIGVFITILAVIGVAIFLVLSWNESQPGAQSSEETGGLKARDCGDDMLCLISASRNCEPSKIEYTYTNEIFGVERTITAYYELKGMEADKCLFYIRTKSIDVKYTNDLIQQMKNSGISQEAITQKEQVENIKADASEGKDATCKILTSDLTDTLNIWRTNSLQVGTFSNEIWKYSGCAGNYFS